MIVTPANISDEKTKVTAEKIYQELLAAGIETVLDDRDERAGIKFKDADLIGIPFRVTIGEKSLAKNVVEVKARIAEKAEEIAIERVVAHVIERVTSQRT